MLCLLRKLWREENIEEEEGSITFWEDSRTDRMLDTCYPKLPLTILERIKSKRIKRIPFPVSSSESGYDEVNTSIMVNTRETKWIRISFEDDEEEMKSERCNNEGISRILMWKSCSRRIKVKRMMPQEYRRIQIIAKG